MPEIKDDAVTEPEPQPQPESETTPPKWCKAHHMHEPWDRYIDHCNICGGDNH